MKNSKNIIVHFRCSIWFEGQFNRINSDKWPVKEESSKKNQYKHDEKFLVLFKWRLLKLN